MSCWLSSFSSAQSLRIFPPLVLLITLNLHTRFFLSWKWSMIWPLWYWAVGGAAGAAAEVHQSFLLLLWRHTLGDQRLSDAREQRRAIEDA
jgi:hypothetical protein